VALPDKDTMAAIAVTRFGLGARPGELEAAKNDPKAWLKAQITRGPADQPPGDLPNSAEAMIAYREAQAARKALQAAQGNPTPARPGLPMAALPAPTPQAMRQQLQAQPSAAAMSELARARAVIGDGAGIQDEFTARAQLASSTDAPFRERWVMFWANHFTVSATKGAARPLVGPFEREVIRPNAFGRFEDMLVLSSSHPAMLFYLDQAQSTGPNSPRAQQAERARNRNPNAQKIGLNENLAREIMELHTVGVGAGYTQNDVTEFARAMTGWSVGTQNEGLQYGKFTYREQTHEPGERTVMGKKYRDTGGTQALAIIKDLAAHPATARHVARKLAVHFVSDDPPANLVTKLEQAFISSKGDLNRVANTLVDADEAWAPAPAKFKTPYEFIISAHRSLGVAPLAAAPRPQQSAQQMVLQPLSQMGQPPFAAASPKGWAEDTSTWASPDGLIKRLNWSQVYAPQVAMGPREPMTVAQDALGKRLTNPTVMALAAAESRPEALTILFMSPEFQRR
jgi:uncharacterized protein (DUF1800 family)